MAKIPNAKKATNRNIQKAEKELPKELNLFEKQMNVDIPLEITNPTEDTILNIKEDSSIGKLIENEERIIATGENEHINCDINAFSKLRPIYLEIHMANFIQYLSAGVIYPNKYSKQNAFSDPQSFNKEALLFSNGDIALDKGEIITIQVDSSSIDDSLLITAQHFALYTGIIPISRIIKIFVTDVEVKTRLIDSTLLRDGGYIPESLLMVGMPENLRKVMYIETKVPSLDMSNQLRLYDRILGTISGIKNFNILSFKSTGNSKSISDHCLFAIQAIKSDFAIDVIENGYISEFYKWLFSRKCPEDRILLQWIFNRVNEHVNFTDSDTEKFAKLCLETNAFTGEEKEIKVIFSYLTKSIERKKALSEILKLTSKNSSALYIFAYLRNYATMQNPEQARTDLVYYGANKYSEYSFAVLNYFFGYKLLRNSEDRLKLSDISIEKLFNTKPPIKFEIKTLFDYKVIDLVFDYSFKEAITLNENNYNNYENIESRDITINGNALSFIHSTSYIYGKEYQKVIVNSEWEQYPILETLPEEISIFSDIGLFCYRLSLKMQIQNIMNLIENPTLLKNLAYFSKNDLKKAVNEKKVDLDELQQRIVLSQKHKEL